MTLGQDTSTKRVEEPTQPGSSPARGAIVNRPGRFAFVTALVLSLPMFILVPYGVSLQSSDSAVVVNTASLVKDIDGGWLLKSQEPPLLQAVYGPWLGRLSDSQPLVAIPLAFTVLLAALTAAVAARLTRSAFFGLFGGLALLAMRTPVPQGRLLPLYAAFIGFGMIGVWMAIDFIRQENASRWGAVAAALCTLMSVVAHGAGLYFLTLVLACLVFVGDRRSLKRYVELVAILMIAFAPWVVAHLWIGGLDQALSPRSTWFTAQGYLARVTIEFWHQAVEGPGDIATMLPTQQLKALGWVSWVAVPLSVIGMLKLSIRARVFVVIAALGLVAPLILYQTRVFAHYFYPLLPGVAILAALGLGSVGAYMRSSRFRTAFPVLAGALVATVTIGFLGALTFAVDSAREERASPERTDLITMGSLIDDGRAVIAWRRSTVLMLEAPQVFVYYADVLTEQEFVSYLTWQRNRVEQTLRRRNIGWALVRKPAGREVRYNGTWLEPAYGVTPTYPRELRRDPMSCLAYDGTKYRLYRLRPGRGESPGGICS